MSGELPEKALDFELTGSEIKHSFQYLFSLKPDGSVMGGTFQYSRGFFLHVDAAGKLTVREKHRPKSKVIRACAEKALAFADGGAEYSGPVWIFHSACRADAEAVAERVGQLLPKLKEPPRIGEIGATIGCHTGPGTVALFFLGTPRDLHE